MGQLISATGTRSGNRAHTDPRVGLLENPVCIGARHAREERVGAAAGGRVAGVAGAAGAGALHHLCRCATAAASVRKREKARAIVVDHCVSGRNRKCSSHNRVSTPVTSNRKRIPLQLALAAGPFQL